jgi:NCS1 family nucleobase:cation symporter-1
MPVCVTFIEVLGTLLAAASQVVYHTVLWSPMVNPAFSSGFTARTTDLRLLCRKDIAAHWDNRAGKFFVGLLFAFANISTNVSGGFGLLRKACEPDHLIF